MNAPASLAAARARRSGHPSAGVDLYDWQAHPDKPTMPTLIACALDRIGQHLENPLLVTRSQAAEALAAIRGHYRGDTDLTPPHGIPRPGAS